MKIFQISIEVNSGSVGRIAEQIGEVVLDAGYESYITFARNNLPSKSKVIKIGSMYDVYFHVLSTRIFDDHCFKSKKSTKNLIQKIEEINPDIIHLHHLHGYFINIEVLFEFLNRFGKPVVWTFHDCWSFTGHCAYYEYVDCQKWQTECHRCPQKKEYPKSIVLDRSKKNFIEKNKIFNSYKNITIVPVSYWLEGEVRKSFLKKFSIHTIQNGIDLTKFYPQGRVQEIFEKYKIKKEKLVLGVASTWEKRKGLEYFLKLSKILPDNYQVMLVGLSERQKKQLPESIIGIERTESIQDLAELYTAANVFVNPTLEDTFPTTNLEALACGTPIVTFRSGGSPESVTYSTGRVVEKGDIDGLVDAIKEICSYSKDFFSENCRKEAENKYDKAIKFKEYLRLYERIYKKDVL
ncbi:glycosyltransferase [Elizabethkingia meningoseptica]|uniref:glycosyltransferase n=1 Tax=Elizabethkingia meningoseptica TaxID=238 RepID=UPI0023B126EA|nr:glycosyltransferase [Elizabethkingia meningoseptica]